MHSFAKVKSQDGICLGCRTSVIWSLDMTFAPRNFSESFDSLLSDFIDALIR